MAKKIIYAVAVLSIACSMRAYCKENSFEIQGLISGPDSKKLEIIEKIAGMGDKVYLPELAALLDIEKSEEVRSKAALALLSIGDSICIPYYKKALSDRYWQVRLYGIQGLIKYGSGEVVPDLKQAMGDSYWQVRYYGAIGLNKYGDETAIPFLLASLKDENEKVKGEVLWALLSLMWKDSSRAAFKALPDSEVKPVFDEIENSNPEIRIRTLWLLEASGDNRAVPLFIKMLEDDNEEIKIRALWAIEKFKAEEGHKQIESLLVEEPTRIKIETIKTLVRLKSAEGLTGIINGLFDKDEKVRIYSLWAVEKFRDPVSYPYIVEKLADSSSQVREYAYKLIESISDPVLSPMLRRFAEDEANPVEARLASLVLVGSIGDGSEKPFMLEKTRDSNPMFRYSAVKALFMLDMFDKDYLKVLAYIENFDSSSRVRRQASLFLREIISGLQSKLESEDKDERSFALSRLDSLYGTRRLIDLLLKMAYSKYPEVREKMLLAAADLPDRAFAKSLQDLFEEPDMDIKKLAAFAMGATGDKGSIPMLKEGIRHFDPEFQLICAWALARMGAPDALPFGFRYLQSSNVKYQKLAAEIFVFLSDSRASNVLLRSLIDSELEIKILSAWALARMGEEKGLETLVRLSEESIEPVRTSANIYLKDKVIPLNLRRKIPAMREKLQFEKLGLQEAAPKAISALKAASPIEIDGSGSDRLWLNARQENRFILVNDDKVPSEIQTKVAAGYDSNNLYFLFICEDPGAEKLTFNSRDFITLSLNPLNSDEKWYQFVVHPLGDIKYSYVWKLYKNEEPERLWASECQIETKVEKSSWTAEMAIPISSLHAEQVFPGDIWSVNFQRDSEQVPLTTWTGRIDNPEQFGIINFKE